MQKLLVGKFFFFVSLMFYDWSLKEYCFCTCVPMDKSAKLQGFRKIMLPQSCHYL